MIQNNPYDTHFNEDVNYEYEKIKNNPIKNFSINKLGALPNILNKIYNFDDTQNLKDKSLNTPTSEIIDTILYKMEFVSDTGSWYRPEIASPVLQQSAKILADNTFKQDLEILQKTYNETEPVSNFAFDELFNKLELNKILLNIYNITNEKMSVFDKKEYMSNEDIYRVFGNHSSENNILAYWILYYMEQYLPEYQKYLPEMEYKKLLNSYNQLYNVYKIYYKDSE